MNLAQIISDVYLSLQGKYVPKYSKGKLVPVCNNCFKAIEHQGIYHPASKFVFDTEECRDAMVSDSGRIYCENKEYRTLVSLVEINALKQPKRGDVAPKNQSSPKKI